MKRALTALGVLFLLAIGGLAWNYFYFPPLLRGVHAGGGLWDQCTAPENLSDVDLAVSPEFDARLKERFPPGSDEQDLIRVLKSQGFKDVSQCDENSATHVAVYRGNLGLAFATASWQSDEAGHVLWTRGMVSYTFL